MPGALAKLVEGLREQRRRARHEEPHRPAIVGAERRQREEARVERRHAHHHRRARQQRADFVGVELREPEHARARQQRAMAGDEQSVHVIDRQRVQQHVAAREAPMPDERQRVAREIAMRQHRAFGTARGPGRVENRRDVVRLRDDRVERRRLVVGAIEQRSLAGSRASAPAPRGAAPRCARRTAGRRR